MKVKNQSKATQIVDLSLLDSTMLYALMKNRNFLSAVTRPSKTYKTTKKKVFSSLIGFS